MDWLKNRDTDTKEAEEIFSALLMEAGAKGVSVEGDNEACAKGRASLGLSG